MPARLPLLRPDDLTEAQRALYDKLITGERATTDRAFPLTDEEGHLQGPFNGMLLNPALGDALQQVGVAVRYATSLTPRQRELATLTVAASEASPYEWSAHSHLAKSAGLTDPDLEAIQANAPLPLPDPTEQAVLQATRELLKTGTLTNPTFEEASETLGLTPLYELVTLVGYYRLLALQLRTFNIPAPDATNS